MLLAGVSALWVAPSTQARATLGGANLPHLTTIGPPLVSIERPLEGVAYAAGRLEFAFLCTEADSGPGLESCLDSEGAGLVESMPGAYLSFPFSARYSETVGEHEYTVSAASHGGERASASIHYKVAAPPQAMIDSPQEGGVYAPKQEVKARFACEEGTLGTGLQSCEDSNHAGAVGGEAGEGALDTSTVGHAAYTVTATSKDGQHASASIRYTVAAPPSATISAPASGGVYPQNALVASAFSCAEGAYGTGIESCVDSNGAHSAAGVLDTASIGEHSYTVTATSKDGQRETATIHYTVVLALSIGTTSCDGAYLGHGHEVLVPSGAACTLLAGARVSGSVIVQRGGALLDAGAVIGGSLHVDGGASIQVGGGGSIGGALELVGLAGAPRASDDSLCDSTVRGDLLVTGERASAPLDVGSAGACSAGPGLRVGGSVRVRNNAGSVKLEGVSAGGAMVLEHNSAGLRVSANTANGSIEVQSNSGGGTLTDNLSIRGACRLYGNSPKITGSHNGARPGALNTCNRSA